ncbi:MAG: carbon-nitrogen hydrolase family protein [Anaerostipes sp.]|jgi:predicted amidohydrolase|nr:carbon-nitrogen hydrolase family protein [Anaerostipes sp.]MDD3745019.1 carbon-nitrogen hydrolase family protein [Anaerostipes sp.]
MKCNVVCIQTEPKMYEKQKNLAAMERMLEEAVKKYSDVDLVVFPELCVTGYQCGDKFYELAEKPEDASESVAFMSCLARKYGVHIIYGMAEQDMEKKEVIYNSQFFIDDEGELLGTYHKVHLFASEKAFFTPGDEFKVFDTKIGRIGLFICYDAFFPEAARCLAVQGVDLLVNSTNWEKPYDYDMDMVMAARALENTVYLACCNRIGEDTTLGFFGHTRILNPLGQVISKVEGEVEDIIYASLDYEKAKQMKVDYYTMLTERRPEVYEMM